MREKLALQPSDLAGKKIRVSASPIERAIVASFGANPVAMGASEVYTALQQGTVDGEGFPIASLLAFKHYEAAPYISQVDFQGFAGVGMINRQFFEGLPADLQEIFRNTADAVTLESAQLFATAKEEGIAELERQGCTVQALDAAQRAAFVSAASSVYGEFSPTLGEDWIAEIRATLETR